MATADVTLQEKHGQIVFEGELIGETIGLPTGWTEDASDPANVSSNGGTLLIDDAANFTELDPGTVITGSDTTNESYKMLVGGGIQSTAPLNTPCFSANGAESATVALDAGGLLVSNLDAPAGDDDAATKKYVDDADDLLAPLASPTFTSTPAAPTATLGTNTTQLATTAFVGKILLAGSGVPGASFLAPLYYDTTAVTGGLYAWDGTAYVHVSAVV